MNNILCFGDSNTFGFNPSNGKRFDKNVRWTGILQALCKDNFHIVEAGCNNRTAFVNNPSGKLFTGKKLLPEILDKDFSFVILALGINDLQFQYNVTLGDIKQGIGDIIKIVKNSIPKTKIILISPTTLTPDVLTSPIFSKLFDNTSIEKSKYLPSIYKELANTNNCDFIDLNKLAKPSTLDGLHFEPDEHKKIAQEIFKHLN